MDNEQLEKALSRIIQENQKARSVASDRTSRLMEVFLTGDREKYSEVVNDIIDAATGRGKENDQVSGETGEAKPPDGGNNSAGS